MYHYPQVAVVQFIFWFATPILNPVTQTLWSKHWRLKTTKTKHKRLPNDSFTVLVWTCNKQWHRGLWLDGMNWSVHPVRQIDGQHLYVLEGRGWGCSGWHTIVFYMRSTNTDSISLKVTVASFIFRQTVLLKRSLNFRHILAFKMKNYDIQHFDIGIGRICRTHLGLNSTH